MSGRKHDIRLTICQDNTTKNITISDMHDGGYTLSRLLGFSEFEMQQKSFNDLVSDKVKEDIEDYVEFTAHGKDIADVLNAMRHFTMAGKKGEYVALNVKALRNISDGTLQYFTLALGAKNTNAAIFRALNAIQADETIYEDIGVADEKSFLRKLDVVITHVGVEDLQASIAVFGIDKFREINQVFGDETAQGLLQEVTMRSRQVLRQSDVMGYLGNGKFGVVLLGTDKHDANIPMARLRSFLSSKPLFLSGNDHIKASLTTLVENIVYEHDAGELLSVATGSITLQQQGMNKYLDL